MTRCFLKLGSDLNKRCDTGTLADRCNHLIKFFDENPERKLETGELIGEQLIETALSLFPTYEPSRRFFATQHTDAKGEARAALVRALDIDGFTFSHGVLRSALPSELDLPQAQDDITCLLNKHKFETPKDHLDQALAAHGRGEWASSNAQLRSFFEALLDEICERIDPESVSLPSGENRRAKLAEKGFLNKELNEWTNDGKNFVNGLFKRLHPSGSHPGLSDQDDCTFRRHIVLLTAKLILARFDSWPPRG